MLFSLLPPLSYYQGFLCQKQLIRKAGSSFLHLWDGKSDVTPRLRGQLLWEVNRNFILAAFVWKCCRYSFSVFPSWMGCCLTTCKLKHGFPTICFHQMKLPISGLIFFFFSSKNVPVSNRVQKWGEKIFTGTNTNSICSLASSIPSSENQ